MRKRVFGSIVLTVACTLLSFGALAEDRIEREAFEHAGAFFDNVFADDQARPLEEEKLDELRGRLPSPTLRHTGVVLWDEPRKGLPPQRGSNDAPPTSGVSSGIGVNILR